MPSDEEDIGRCVRLMIELGLYKLVWKYFIVRESFCTVLTVGPFGPGNPMLPGSPLLPAGPIGPTLPSAPGKP